MDHDGSSQVITVPPSKGPVPRPADVRVTFAIVGTAFLSAWILLANLVLIVALISSSRRRKISFNIHVINLAIASIVMGGLVLPLHIDFQISETWQHSDVVCRLWLISDLMVNTVSVLIMGFMVFDRFVLFSCTSCAQGGGKFILSAMVFLLPWALASAFVIPVYLVGETGIGVDSSKGQCFLNMNTAYSVMFVIGGFFVPTVATCGILVAMTLTWCVRKENLHHRMERIEEIKDCGWQVALSWLMCLTVLGMWLPFNTLYLLMYAVNITFTVSWLESAMWLAYANAGVTPILWLVMPTVRQSVARLFCCCCCGKPKDTRRRNLQADCNIEDNSEVAMLQFRYKL